MGGNSSAPMDPPALGADNVHIPSWASRVEKGAVVFFDIAINDQPYGRIEITLAQVSCNVECCILHTILADYEHSNVSSGHGVSRCWNHHENYVNISRQRLISRYRKVSASPYSIYVAFSF